MRLCQHLGPSPGPGPAVQWATLAAAACLSLYLYVAPRPARTIRARARDAARCPSPAAGGPPYPPHVFPGARDVETEYEAIRVFEWGPEDGDKVLLLHGIGTPCVALGDMANELLSRGCRVMLFGESLTRPLNMAASTPRTEARAERRRARGRRRRRRL